MTIAEQWERKGFQKGFEKGVQLGMQQGAAGVLQRHLQKHFGDLPAIYIQRIADADMETLLNWIGESVDAKTLADVFD